jgi:D-beta-D-heptose 7-phosphate kinase/D-beta-D-heptose 1-phosphate adenosyltransferase
MLEVFKVFQARASSAHILVVGDVMLDEYIWGSATKISQEAPVPILEVSGRSCVPGGAANAANNLAALGCHVSLMGVIGEDKFGLELDDRVRKAGISPAYLLTDKGRTTTLKTRIMAQNQQLLRIDVEGREPISSYILESFLGCLRYIKDPVHAIVFSDYSNGMFRQELFDALVEMAQNSHIPLLVDPKRKAWERYEGATALTPNMEELAVMAGESIPMAEGRLQPSVCLGIAKSECQYLLLTQGEKGMTLYRKEREASLDDIESTAIPITKPRAVFDVSGAGDTVMAVFALGLALEQDPVATARLANLAAGIVVGKLGTATASLEEIGQELEKLGQAASSPKFL